MVSRTDPHAGSGRKEAAVQRRRQPDLDHAAATWTVVAGAAPTELLVPVGSCEQHGPHLPLDTDTRIAVAIAEAAARQRDRVRVAPALAYGASGEHQSFPGTLSIGTEALTTVLVEIGRSAFPDPPAPEGPTHRSLVFVNGHGGNSWAVRRAVEVLRQEGRPATSWAPAVADGDAHAGRTETSLLLAIAPDRVGEDRPVGDTRPLRELAEMLRTEGVRAVSPNGVLGNASGASAAEGHELLERLVEDLLDHIEMTGSSAGSSPGSPE